MSGDALKLTVYFGENDRVGGNLLSDELLGYYERNALRTAILLRGTEGFGIKHQLRTQRLLTLSEDLPLASIAIDSKGKIEAALPEVSSLVEGGLITLERAQLLGGAASEILASRPSDASKLTIYVGRGERVGREPVFKRIVALLHEHGLAGATVLAGVDGILHGTRRRARFFAGNADVPLMIISVGDSQSLATALAAIVENAGEQVATLERVQLCKRDGVVLAEPSSLAHEDGDGLGVWQKLMVFVGEQARHGKHPLYLAMIHALREAKGSGATGLRGVWGFSGDHQPHGDTFLQLKRQVPVVMTVVDTPARIQHAWQIINELTDEAGLVTSEIVPAFQAVGPNDLKKGGLRMARPRH